ncbi:MAG: glycosyltransferase [Thermoanaerobaculia bacterium]
MKVAVLAHSFPRFRGDTHGPFVKRLSEELAGLGHEVHALVPFDPEIRDDPETPLTLHSFRYVRPDRWHLLGYSRTLQRDVAMRLWAWLLSPLYFLFAERALKRLVRRQRIDLIHAHWLLPNGYVASRVSRSTGVPFVVTLHGSDIFMAERNPLFRSMARRTLAGARHVTSCSADLRDRLLALGRPQDAHKVLLVANGTDLEAPTEMPAEDAGTGERLVVGVGRMVDKKGFRYFLDAAPALLAAHPEVRIVLGGDGDLLESLKARTAELGIADRVDFPGRLSHPEVLRLIAGAEVFVMPSVRDQKGNIDGLPIVVLEAMAAAKPLVATELAGMPLAVEDGVTGLLVPEKDPEALRTAVDALLADPARARAMGRAGRAKVVADLNWRAIARRHDELYRDPPAA